MKNLFILNDKFILPIAIKVLYSLAVITSISIGIYLYLWNDGYILIVGIFFVIALPFFIRVYAEVLIVLFKIYKKMQLISELKAKKIQRENTGE